MSGNAITISPLIPLTQPLETIQLTPANVENVSLKFAVPNNIGLITAYDPLGNQIFIQSEPVPIRKPVDVILKPNLPLIPIKDQPFIQHKPSAIFLENVKQEHNNNGNNYNPIIHTAESKIDDVVVYQITYPEDLNLKSVKRGRTKSQDKQENIEKETKQPPVKAPRTRSGRIVKTPKHIEKDFEKILITNEPEVKTAKFLSIEDDKQEKKDLQELEHHFKKKTIPSQFRCSFCKKAYFGKRAMYQHLLKNPNHGPLPDKNNNFDVWNYLVDITQKCPSGRRGTKFCEELTNLLHNLQLLTSALFKNNDTTKNAVQIDKVLGNAIGLEPGKYNFDENELYKDVTVLKLITNSQFFAPKKTTPNTASTTKVNTELHNVNKSSDQCKTIEESKCSSSVSNLGLNDKNKMESSRVPFNDSLSLLNAMNIVTNPTSLLDNQIETVKNIEGNVNSVGVNTLHYSQHGCIEKNDKSIRFDDSVDNIVEKVVTFPQNLGENNFTNTQQTIERNYSQKLVGETKTSTDLKLSPTECINSFNKSIEEQVMDTKLEETSLSLHSDLLSDNSLLALPTLRTSVDELLSNVDAGSNLLDNSTSSDEMMNVDQFVNERFKKITEPDTDLKFNTSLNLDLPSLDLFQFHTS